VPVKTASIVSVGGVGALPGSSMVLNDIKLGMVNAGEVVSRYRHCSYNDCR